MRAANRRAGSNQAGKKNRTGIFELEIHNSFLLENERTNKDAGMSDFPHASAPSSRINEHLSE
jgi:hypothetical protein